MISIGYHIILRPSVADPFCGEGPSPLVQVYK